MHELKKEQEQKRRQLQSFLQKSVLDKQAEMQAIFYDLSTIDFASRSNFSEENLWDFSAGMLAKHAWLDFIQTGTKMGKKKVHFTLTPFAVEPKKTSVYEIDETLSWVYVKDRLYISILIPSKVLENLMGENASGLAKEDVHVAYDWKTLLYISPKNWSDQDKKTPFVKQLLYAKEYLKTHEKKLLQGDFRALLKQSTRKKNVRRYHDSSGSSLEKAGEKRFRYFVKRNQILAIGLFATHLSFEGLVQEGPLSPYAPAGVIFTPFPREKPVFFPFSGLFRKTAFLTIGDGAAKNSSSFQKKNIELLSTGYGSEAFLVSTQSILWEAHRNNTLELMLGASVDPIMRKVAIASGQMVLLTEGKRVLALYRPNGEKLDRSPILQAKVEHFDQPIGRISIGGISYIYAQLSPFHHADINIFTLQEESKAYALINHTNREIHRIVSSISSKIMVAAFFMLVVALILLENIARKITRPIARLAAASTKIKEGHMHDVPFLDSEKGASKEVVSLVHSFNAMVKDLSEKEKVRSILNKMVSKEVAAELLKKELHLGGQIVDAVVLFADIRGFTKLTEHMQPEQVIEMLNTCMTKITSIVEKKRGVIDKYVGDQAMALFGAPFPIEDPYQAAVESAISIQQAFSLWNQERLRKKEPLIELGIGINGGKVLAGNMGAEDRLNYTVLGAEVNLAARLCKEAKGGEILLSSKMLEKGRLSTSIETENRGSKSFKGFSDSFTVHAVQGLRSKS